MTLASPHVDLDVPAEQRERAQHDGLNSLAGQSPKAGDRHERQASSLAIISTPATLFLDTLQRRLPFPLRALQVDGGSEFAAVLEAASQQHP